MVQTNSGTNQNILVLFHRVLEEIEMFHFCKQNNLCAADAAFWAVQQQLAIPGWLC
jgi:hypothetical protein